MKLCIYDDDDNEILLPTKKEVCFDCGGEGVRALHGYDVTDQCAEDPEFAEDYFAGHYDTTCESCKGNRVVDVVDEDQLTPWQLNDWYDAQEEESRHWQDCEAERRAGC